MVGYCQNFLVMPTKLACFVLLAIFSSNPVFSQIENIEVGENTVINKLYTGLYARTRIPIDSLVLTNQVSYRVGVLATQELGSIFSISTQAALDTENDRDLIAITDFELITKITAKVQLRIGSLTTPNTLIRPNPITWQSQSETYAQSRIIGGRPGVLAIYRPSSDLGFTYGYHFQNDEWASHARIDYRNLKIGGYYQNDGEYFAVIDYDTEKAKVTTSYSSFFDEFATSVFYNITDRYTLYADTNFFESSAAESNNSVSVARLGGRSYFENQAIHLKGFLALEYDFATELFSAEIFIHLR